MHALYVRIDGETGATEATAFSREHPDFDGVAGPLLPPGRWRLVDATTGDEWQMDIEDMPLHWQRQIHAAGEFGKRLKRP